jgi:hypothetical protein
MKNLYQTEWHNISFSNFTELSSSQVAGPDFYDAFYRSLFENYPDYNALDLSWRLRKDEIADWLAATISPGSRVLSVGCGLGYIEQRLWGKHLIDLHVSDYASESLRWLRQVLPAERIHDAKGSKNNSEPYNVVFLCGVDYALSNKELVDLLIEVKGSLCNGGEILMISASFLMDESIIDNFVQSIKDAVKSVLTFLGVRHREFKGQLWGWMRTRSEYSDALRSAGFTNVLDGFITTPNQQTYWIKAGGISKVCQN